MSKQKLELTPPVESPQITIEHPDVPHTFGRDAVLRGEYLTGNILLKGYLDQEVAYGDQLETETSSDNSNPSDELGKLAIESIVKGGHRSSANYHESKKRLVGQMETAHRWVKEDKAHLKDRLDKTRDRLRALSPAQRNDFNLYVSMSVPWFMIGVMLNDNKIVEGEVVSKLPHEQPNSWHDWFAEKATNEQLLNFLQWHVDALDHQQSSPETKEMINAQRGVFQKGVGDGVAAGWLHPEASLALVEVKKVKVLIGDEFDTIMQERGGYHQWGSGEVVIAQGRGRSKEHRAIGLRASMHHALKHEWNHAVLSGRDFDRWFEEAMTEHCAEVYDDGMPDVFNPHQRPNKGVYIEERSLVDVLANFGDANVPARLYTKYYSAKTIQSRVKAFAELKQGLKAAWGAENVYADVSKAIYEYEDEALADGKTQREAEKLALNRVRSDLLQQPHVIFGKTHQLARVN